MKITRVETIVLNLPMLIDGATPMLGGRARTSIDMLLVRIDTDGGITGWGEAFGHRIFPATRAAIDTILGPMCVGRDPSQIAAINDEIQRVLHGIGRSGPTIYALSGIDIALWDIAGKVAGVPLYRLLGGSPRADGRTCPPTRACSATAPPRPWPTTRSRRWPAAIASSSCTRSPCPR